jgi:serine/threonine protein kinase
LKQDEIVEQTMGPEIIDELVNYDKHQNYVIKEFMNPNIAQRAIGNTKKTYMMRELNGFQSILHVVKKHKVVGMPYKKTILFGFEIELKDTTRCFVINRKCKEVMTQEKVNSFTESQFVHFVEDILKLLIEIQKYNLAHGDIKLDNIMKCESNYELIDWENCRKLNYSNLIKHRYFGLSPFYFKLLYGPAWYPSFKIALLKYYSETGGYDTQTTSQYADNMNEYYSQLFAKHTIEKVFDLVKHSLDLCAFGMILYGIMLRNPHIKKKHHFFIMNLYKIENATMALKMFRSKKTRKK